jgi:hypothetical protein
MVAEPRLSEGEQADETDWPVGIPRLADCGRCARGGDLLDSDAPMRPGPPKAYTQAKRRRNDNKMRTERLGKLKDKREMLLALMAAHEQKENFDEARRLKVRIRTVEQQLRYIGLGAGV